MAGRRKFRVKSRKELRRRGASREKFDRVLIITEGSKTEPSYFRKLINELGLFTAQVEIVGDGGSAPVNVVEDGIRLLGTEPEFQQVYFVFDRDRHDSYDAALDKIRGLRKKPGFKEVTIVAATSVPCFEIWFMMHVSASRKPYGSAKTGGSAGKALLADLMKNEVFSCYDKGECAEFEAMVQLRKTAKTRLPVFIWWWAH
jgi:hypothetical protein